MMNITKNERKALLTLFKDFTSYYNANSLSKILGISRIGTMKMLKKFEEEDLLISERIGKSIVYKPNLENDYLRDLISFLLSDEANNFKRWKKEFKDLFKKDRVVLFYGSASRNYSQAKDIDIMIIRKKGDVKEIDNVITARQKFISKGIHKIDLTPEEFMENLKAKKVAIIEIVKSAIVLYGQHKYVELIKNVKSF